ncbi:MAG: hypothetical protein AAGB15_06660, partial [Pseudomonadota bacterium]
MLKELFGAPWWLVVGLGVYGLCWGVFHDLHDKPVSRRKWIVLLRNHHWLRAYRRELGVILDWIDRRLSAEVDGKERPEGWGWKPDQARTAWSAGLMQFSLLLALGYPILILFGQWALTGAEGRIGTLVVLPADVPWWQRGVTALSFAYLAWARYNLDNPISAGQRNTRPKWVRRAHFFVALALAVAVAFTVAFTVAFIVAVAFALAVALAFA